jgi:TolA-binding protein
MRIIDSSNKHMVFKQQPISVKAAIHANINTLQKYLHELDKFIEDTKQGLQQLQQQLSTTQTDLAIAELQQSIGQLQTMLTDSKLQLNRQVTLEKLAEYQAMLKPD